MTINKANAPAGWLLLPFMAGLCLAIYFNPVIFIFGLKCTLAACSVLFIALNVFYRYFNLQRHKWLGGVLMHLIILLFGVIYVDANREMDSKMHFSKLKTDFLLVKINNEPKFSKGILRFRASAEKAFYKSEQKKVNGNILIYVRIDSAKKDDLFYGDELLIRSAFTPIGPPLNPAEFNYKGYLENQKIYHQQFLNSDGLVVINKNKGNAAVAFALTLRKHLVNKLKLHMPDTNAVALASTIILGYRAELSKQVEQTFANTGTMHLLAVSGMHVALIYFLISLLTGGIAARFKHGQIVKTIIGITLIWAYALITGFSPAVCRATLMLTLGIIGFTFNRHLSRLNILAAAAFILLLYNPLLLTDAGFQLSCMAVFGIILLQPVIYKWFKFKHNWAKKLWMFSSVSIAAQFILFPFSFFYFHKFPVFFLVSNLFVIVPSAIVMYCGIIYLALPQIPYISAALGWILEKTILVMTKTLAVVESSRFASINKIWVNTFEVVILYVLIAGLLLFVFHRDKLWLKLSFVPALILCASISYKTYVNLNTKAITFFSLRKNSGILFRNGYSGVIVTDLKQTDEAFQYAVQACLDSCGVSDVQVVDLFSKKNVTKNYFAKQGNVLQFTDKKILIFDNTLLKAPNTGKLSFDFLYLNGNPNKSLQFLKQNYNFKTLLADGHSTDKTLKLLQHDAVLAKTDFINLKRNKAFIVASNSQHTQ